VLDASPLLLVMAVTGFSEAMLAEVPESENVTRAPGTTAPAAFLTTAVTVPGEDELICAADRLIKTLPPLLLTAPVVPLSITPSPPLSPFPLHGGVPASPPPPPHALSKAAQHIAKAAARNFRIVI
jgi:hypothetical protein